MEKGNGVQSFVRITPIQRNRREEEMEFNLTSGSWTALEFGQKKLVPGGKILAGLEQIARRRSIYGTIQTTGLSRALVTFQRRSDRHASWIDVVAGQWPKGTQEVFPTSQVTGNIRKVQSWLTSCYSAAAPIVLFSLVPDTCTCQAACNGSSERTIAIVNPQTSAPGPRRLQWKHQ